MKMKKIKLLTLIFATVMLITSCRKDKGIENNDSFSIENTTYKPLTISCGPGSNYWRIDANYQVGNTGVGIRVYLPGTTRSTSSGTFALQSDYTNLTLGNACIKGTYAFWQNPSKYYSSISGQLNIFITNNGKVHAVFNNVPAKDDNDSTKLVNLAGDITCH